MADPLTLISIGSTVLGAASQYKQGKAAQQAAKYEAQQMQVNAGQQRASAQRQLIEDNRKKNLTKSRAQAVAAAQGASALDPSIVDIMSGLEAEGNYNAAVNMYESETGSRNMEGQANMRLFEGKQAKKASMIRVGGQLLKGGASIYERYGATHFSDGSPKTTGYGDSKIYWETGRNGRL